MLRPNLAPGFRSGVATQAPLLSPTASTALNSAARSLAAWTTSTATESLDCARKPAAAGHRGSVEPGMVRVNPRRMRTSPAAGVG